MNEDPLTPIEPLRGIGRNLMILNLLGIIFIWFLGIYSYSSLEGLIPYNFDLSGQPTEYGSSEMFLIITPVMSLAQIIILIVSKYRFTLLNKYSSIINLPAFYTYIIEIPFEKRGYWVNKYFEVVLAVSVSLSLLTSLLFRGVYLGAIYEEIPNWFIPVSLSTAPLIVAPMIYAFYRLSKQMKKATEQK